MVSDLTQADLRRLFMYAPATGELVRRARVKGAKVGAVARSPNAAGYLRVCVRGRLYYVHRLVWLWHCGRWPDYQLDHIDRNKTNNRIENLREATQAQNQQNIGTRANNTSGHTGVYWYARRAKWVAEIQHDGTRSHLGYYADIDAAVAARKDAERQLHSHTARID